MFSANDTLPADGPVVRGPEPLAARDRTAELARIVRHALNAAVATGPLDRAIRSAARLSESLPAAMGVFLPRPSVSCWSTQS